MHPPNGGTRHFEQIDRTGAGATVLDHLTRTWPQASAEVWRQRIEAGLVSLDERPAAPEQVLRPGQRLCWARPPWVEPEAPLATAVLYEDPHLLVVAKPSGLPTLPGGGFQDHTLLALVRRRYSEATPMHRLGRATSGVVLFAPTRAACAPLQAAFQESSTRKRYRALCSGAPAEAAFSLRAPIGPVPYPPLGTIHGACPEGRPSHSEARVLEVRPEGTLLEVELHTGRPHQIRIHLAHAGHPLVGDPLYAPGGRPWPEGAALPGDPGYLLHAHSLELRHPATGKMIKVVCAPPPRLRRADGT